VYTGSVAATPAGNPATLSYGQLGNLNGGRLPIGFRLGNGSSASKQVGSDQSVPVTYTGTRTVTFRVAEATGRVVDLRWAQGLTVMVKSDLGPVPVGLGTALSTFDAGASGSASTIGVPASPCSRSRGSSGTWPKMCG